MHYHCEIIMPPTADVDAAVTKIMAPFEENEESARHSFWDWWQIGGRYSGAKLEAQVQKSKMDEFYEELKRRKITVSGLVWGKQELYPASQQEEVDTLWRQMSGLAGPCPIFKHSGDKMDMDVCTVSELPSDLTAFTVIIAAPDYRDELCAETILHREIWNGASIQDTTFDGSVKAALDIHNSKVAKYREDAHERYTTKPDWLVVTVDYHS